MRFRRVYRLTHKAEFDLVLTQGTVRVTSGPFRAFGLTRKTSPALGARLGLIVGRRQLPRAVDRNAVKRQVRESFRRSRGGLPAVDVVVRLSQSPAPGVDLAVVLTDLWQQLARAMATQSKAGAI